MTGVLLQVVMTAEEAAEIKWQDQALCAETDPEAFFPEKGGSTREAKRTCRACEVRAECLEYALDHDERFGIWGGMSERERRRLKRAARPPAPAVAAGPRSRFRGVTWTKESRKWRARARVGGERVELGFFTDEKDAARAVTEAEAADRAAQSLESAA
jgi:WhiB family transcriptional regulator, redox-sensing transcriptional regulator